MDPFLGHFWGSKMTPFWPNPVYSSPRPERGGFRGVSKNDPKMTLFKKCQKVSKMTVFRPPLGGPKSDPKRVTFGPFLGPLLGHFPLYFPPKPVNRGSKKGVKK